MKPKTTLWRLEPHTKGKHLVLKLYLDAWLPIMSAFNRRILFIDGFAGPGKYEGGEEGSPIIALKAVCEHSARNKFYAKIVLLFIEKEEDRVQHLRSLIKEQEPSLPTNCTVNVIQGTFDQTLTEVLNQLNLRQAHLAPALVMVDPFGISGTPMSVIKQILSHPKCEVYISFMYDWINRFKETPDFERHLDDLYGCDTWSSGINITDPGKRKDFFYSLYEKSLRECGAKYVLKFELYEGNRLVYAIFFGTQDLKGCDRMKQAIWKIAPWGDFAFQGIDSQQLVMDIATPDFNPLKQALLQQFRNQGWITIKDIENFVASDKTDYHTGHIKKATLVPMEEAGEIDIDETTRGRKCTYPEGTRIRFL